MDTYQAALTSLTTFFAPTQSPYIISRRLSFYDEKQTDTQPVIVECED